LRGIAFSELYASCWLSIGATSCYAWTGREPRGLPPPLFTAPVGNPRHQRRYREFGRCRPAHQRGTLPATASQSSRDVRRRSSVFCRGAWLEIFSVLFAGMSDWLNMFV